MSALEELAAAVLQGRVKLEVLSQTDPRYGHVNHSVVSVVVLPPEGPVQVPDE